MREETEDKHKRKRPDNKEWNGLGAAVTRYVICGIGKYTQQIFCCNIEQKSVGMRGFEGCDHNRNNAVNGLRCIS